MRHFFVISCVLVLSVVTSAVPLDHRNQIIVDDRVARGPDGQPIASWDWVIVISLQGCPIAAD